jgi:dipeptidyl-peptidase 4
MVDALIKANKDFDLLLIPNVAHGYGAASPYMTRRRWDYFVRYLAGGTPPVEYQMTTLKAAQSLMAGGPNSDDSEE